MNFCGVSFNRFRLDVDYVLAKSNDILTFEGMVKRCNKIGDTSKSPNISLKIILLILNDFGRQIERRANPGINPKIIINNLANPQIPNLPITR
jgi:hypothetical protein